MKYYIKTFGCQMNTSDSERIAGFLEMAGLQLVESINEADLAIFNTCGVRQMAEDRVYGQIHNLKVKSQSASRRTKVKIVLTGCLANRKDVQRRLKDKVYLFTDIKDFQKNIEKLFELSPFVKGGQKGDFYKNKKAKNPSPTLPLEKGESHDYLNLSPKYNSNFTAYVPIMTGCNNFCSYCVVPYARGREVSRPAEEILKEIKKLAKAGYKEIVLLGQNVNSYKDKKINFSRLLKKINAISDNFWISFVSSHPKDFSPELIETTTKLKKVCEIVHLPIQAGDDKVLEKMNRKYTAKHYLSLIKKIKTSFKKNKPSKLYSITSDIIVGFPSETKKQFLQSAKIMKKVTYDMVYFGQYSPRPGTAAFKMKDSVSKKEKVRRENWLNEILKKTAFENNKRYVGEIMEVLIEKEKNDFYFGRTRTMKNVKLTSDRKNLVGKIVKTKIIKANIWNLEAICHPTGGRP